MSQVRLLSPDHAAAYLGLGSRWAIYRLVAAGQLPALRLAGKLRIDRGDLDTLIDELKRPRGAEALARRSTQKSQNTQSQNFSASSARSALYVVALA